LLDAKELASMTDGWDTNRSKYEELCDFAARSWLPDLKYLEWRKVKATEYGQDSVDPESRAEADEWLEKILELEGSITARIWQLTVLGEVSLGLNWHGGECQIGISYNSLLGALAVQMMLAVGQLDALYTCSGCHQPYIRSTVGREKMGGKMREKAIRLPKAGQNNYCSECGLPRAQLDAKRRYRHKIAEARKLCAEGLPVENVAKLLRTEVDRVRGWIAKKPSP